VINADFGDSCGGFCSAVYRVFAVVLGVWFKHWFKHLLVLFKFCVG